ncbi:DUF1987 domain-containing protein [Paenibacillus cremeus]|uniref:DUF1987 domain-containing protein n=1 Tax=Paenibacillus cremeus TaxID=2163881 RepID=A0A559K6F4_9BACL|nr:DUF1987 domain-containing protein [Paenibacillus cremeus]TVY07701.1 DUF1987 domain-containing protein [Paenibacillus cremeus]
MNSIRLEGTKSTPQVIFDAELRVLELSGQSYPENSFAFYDPLLQWAEQFLAQAGKQEIAVKLDLRYMNTSSSRCILMLLEKLNQAYLNGAGVEVHWHCFAENESEAECAEEFQEDLEMPFHIVMKEESDL